MKILLAITFVIVPSLTLLQADAPEKPKYTIKEVMKKAHKEKLLKKVLSGDAKQAEKTALLDLYLSLPENKPPKGDEKDWNKRTTEVVVAAARVVAERERSLARLKKATNCAACHKAHKGK